MKLIRLLHKILREVFEEAAYERFCAREQLQTGTKSYAQFLAQSESPRNQKIRCC